MRYLLPLLLCLCLAPASAQENTDNHVFWREGQPGCEEIYINGVRVRFLTHKGVTVGLLALDVNGVYAFDVGAENATQGRILLDPANAHLLYRDKSGKPVKLAPLAPEGVAKKIKGRHKWGNFFRTFAAGMATRQSRSVSTGQGTIYGTDGARLGTYEGEARTTTTSPDREVQRRVAEQNARRNAEAASEADLTSSAALRANTVFPGRLVHGFIYFEHKKFDRAVFSITVEGVTYTFGLNNSR